MKARKLLNFAVIAFVVFTLVSCEKAADSEVAGGDFPTKFKVDIPSSISHYSTKKSAESGDFDGKGIYEHLNNFMEVGEAASEFIEDIMKSISTYGLNTPMSFSFTSDDDGQTKNIVIVKNSEFENSLYQLQLTLTDADSEGNEDGGIALQVFWNTAPINGIAILKPKNWDTSGEEGMGSTIFRVDYSEAGEHGYDAEMVVYISKWEQDTTDRFHMDNLKMFVGKLGDVVDVYGNSNHPDAWLFLQEPVGFDWAFVASGNDSENIGVAEVGLPLSTLDETSRKILLEDNSIKNVFTAQIREYWYQETGNYPDSAVIAKLLKDTEAPGFFNSNGFVQAGVAPSASYNELVGNIEGLAPYNPFQISKLTISFKK